MTSDRRMLKQTLELAPDHSQARDALSMLEHHATPNRTTQRQPTRTWCRWCLDPPAVSVSQTEWRLLWPVPLWQRTLPGQDEAEIVRYALELEAEGSSDERIQRSNLGGFHSPKLRRDDPRLSRLFAAVEADCGAWLTDAGLSSLESVTLRESWFNVNRGPDYNAWHTHAAESDESIDEIVAVYYPNASTTPLLLEPTARVDDLELWNHALRDGQLPPSAVACRPSRAGELVAFPPFVEHAVPPRPTDDKSPRVTVAMNLRLRYHRSGRANHWVNESQLLPPTFSRALGGTLVYRAISVRSVAAAVRALEVALVMPPWPGDARRDAELPDCSDASEQPEWDVVPEPDRRPLLRAVIGPCDDVAVRDAGLQFSRRLRSSWLRAVGGWRDGGIGVQLAPLGDGDVLLLSSDAMFVEPNGCAARAAVVPRCRGSMLAQRLPTNILEPKLHISTEECGSEHSACGHPD